MNRTDTEAAISGYLPDRTSIRPTYDSRGTGPRYHVTVLREALVPQPASAPARRRETAG